MFRTLRKILVMGRLASGAACLPESAMLPRSPRGESAPVSLPEHRRGVLLLIALVMLALFMLLGTSYILIANRRRPCTAAAGAVGSQAEDFASDTSNAAEQNTIFGQPDGGGHGSTVGATVRSRVAKFFTNSLLTDKYGDWYEEAKLGSITPIAPAGGVAPKTPFYTIIINGPFTYGPETTIAAWQAKTGKTADLGSHVGRILLIESEFEPNAAFRIVAKSGTRYIAHLLNPVAEFDHRNLVANARLTIQGREFSGDLADEFQLHETYDAPDGRNQFMAWVQSDAVLGRDQQPGTSDDPADGHRYIIPSFHRPDKLLAILKSSTASPEAYYQSWLDPTAIALLRPAGKMTWDPTIDWQKTHGVPMPPALPVGNTIEHPNFTGGNSRLVGNTTCYFDPLHGPWDVDNDGDGVTDSIWLDIGMSPVTLDDTEVQPLVAMMILDLDGRINLNAHGNDLEIVSPPTRPSPEGTEPYLRYAGTVSSTATGTAGPKAASLPHAQGWGVADIDPRRVFRGTAPGVVQTVINGGSWLGTQSTPKGLITPAIKAEGRYGDSAGGSGSLSPAPGLLNLADPGIDAVGAAPRDNHLPDSFGGVMSGTSESGRVAGVRSPIDPRGTMTVGLDQLGQPFYSKLSGTNVPARLIGRNGWQWFGDRIDDPYDVSLGRRAPRPGWSFDPDAQATPSTLQDNLFAAPQFERLLRLFEPAADKLSPRLVSLLGANAETARVSATIESWDTPAVTIPRDRLDPLLALSDQSDAARASLISWDLALGLRMDINRPFGDGLDNDNDGVADEPGEYEAEKAADMFGMNGSAFANACLTNGRDIDGDGDVDFDDQTRARELFARHLYVLARTMAPSLPAKDAAQWAVNVVDMRDPDSIITRFPFDPASPGNGGWNASDPANVVWGCERPELLITEAMAWRNIRTGTSVVPEYSDKGTGGLVVELYNPWTGVADTSWLASAVPAEFQATPSGTSGFMPTSEIDLAKVAPGMTAGAFPVFQILAVVETGTTTHKNLADDPTWPKPTGGGVLPGLVIYPANTPDVTVTGSMGTFVGRDGPNVDATTLRPGQIAIVSGPIASGTGGMLANTIDVSASGTAEMQFSYANFSDVTARPVLQLSGSLSEVITGSNGFTSTDRSSARQYPADAASGPVGALVCVENVAQPTSPLRFVAQSGTTADLGYMAAEKYRILLRRLANPQLAYDSNTNPYVCIDSLVVQDQAVVAGSPGTPGRLKSAERCAAQPADKSVNNLWRHVAADDDANVVALAPPKMGQVTGINASLGFLPARLKVPSGADDPAEAEQAPFPWLTWLNREFSSIHELLLVPGSTPATLLQNHSHEWPFPHLFSRLGSGTTAAVQNLEQNKVGILELLRVPSRFADSEMRISPSEAIAISNVIVSNGGRPMFLPPHNYLSEFREPGRVNLNTMSSSAVWSAINNGRPGAPYEDEVAYDSAGTPATFQRSEDWLLTSGSGSSPFAGNWQIDNPQEDINSNSTLDLNHDENNDGKRQVSRSGALQSIAASRRGWPLAADGSTLAIAGQFDRVLNRKGVADDQLWFSKPFQSGWTSGTAAYATDQSLMLRSWSADATANFVRMARPDNYSRLTRTNGVNLSAFSVYRCTIRIRGNTPLDPANTTHKLPELLKNNGYSETVSTSNVSASVADGVTTYTSTLIPSTSGSYNLQIGVYQQSQIDVLSVSFVDGGGTELLTNGDFTDGLTGWTISSQDGSLETSVIASASGPVYLMATNLGLKDSKGKQQDGRPYADPRRNPYFRYREMMRLSNLTTQRSNVFAVWTTVGFFVIEPHPTRTGQTALGPEYGLDNGKRTRFKSFMIIDRSIPVGFRPGVPGNSRDTILLEHFGN